MKPTLAVALVFPLFLSGCYTSPLTKPGPETLVEPSGPLAEVAYSTTAQLGDAGVFLSFQPENTTGCKLTVVLRGTANRASGPSYILYMNNGDGPLRNYVRTDWKLYDPHLDFRDRVDTGQLVPQAPSPYSLSSNITFQSPKTRVTEIGILARGVGIGQSISETFAWRLECAYPVNVSIAETTDFLLFDLKTMKGGVGLRSPAEAIAVGQSVERVVSSEQNFVLVWSGGSVGTAHLRTPSKEYAWSFGKGEFIPLLDPTDCATPCLIREKPGKNLFSFEGIGNERRPAATSSGGPPDLIGFFAGFENVTAPGERYSSKL